MNQIFEVMPTVISEELEGEMIAIDMETGIYYSMNSTAAKVWRLLQKRPSVGQLLDHLTDVYDADKRTIEEGLTSLLKNLMASRVIRECSVSTLSEIGPSAQVHSEKLKFEAPVFEHYEDMKDLLLLDPVHDVNEETGWPRAKQEAG